MEDSAISAASGSASVNMKLANAFIAPLRAGRMKNWRDTLSKIEFVPDLGQDIGSLKWFRGLGTLSVMSIMALGLLPDFGPVYGAPTATPTEAEFEEARAQMIMPLAFGGDTGKRMAATDSVIPLASSPERPRIELTATFGRGDSFLRLLQRAGVGGGEANFVTNMVSNAVSLGEIEPGTQLEIILGSRTSRNAPRPLDSLSFRARFDLGLAISRENGALQLERQPIAVDDTPLRIHGTVGESLYRSARAAGAPAQAIQNFLKIVSTKTNLSRLRANDEFDIIIDHRRAETGEVRSGDLLYAGIERDGKPKVEMLKWASGGTNQWYETSGVGETSGVMGRPVNGAVSSGYGIRRHPVLGYKRMHSGLDFKARHGTPIYAASDGRVSFAGRKGGYGNFIRIEHSGGIATGYGHMSRFATTSGQRVKRGQIIGYVGSTGLSTGPHLHYELYKGGKAINPQSVKFTQRAQLTGSELKKFRLKLDALKSVEVGAALVPLKPTHPQKKEPEREIDRLTRNNIIGGRSG